MKIHNQTCLPTERLREILSFCCPPGVTDFLISFKHGRGITGYSGVAYVDQYKAFFTDKRQGFRSRAYWKKTGAECSDIVIRSPRFARGKGQIEAFRRARGAFLRHIEFIREEALVFVVAHELRHLYQALHPTRQRGRVWGARGQFSERDADAYAIGKVRHWRRRGSPFYNADGSLKPL